MLGGCGNLTAHFGHYELQCVTLRPWDTYKLCLFKSVALSECPFALTGMSVRESVCVCVCVRVIELAGQRNRTSNGSDNANSVSVARRRHPDFKGDQDLIDII